MSTGRAALPVSADTVTWPPTPTFNVATENAPILVAPVISTIPLPPAVAASAMTSDTGPAEPDSNNVLRPGRMETPVLFKHEKFSQTSVGGIAAVGRRVIRNV